MFWEESGIPVCKYNYVHIRSGVKPFLRASLLFASDIAPYMQRLSQTIQDQESHVGHLCLYTIDAISFTHCCCPLLTNSALAWPTRIDRRLGTQPGLPPLR